MWSSHIQTIRVFRLTSALMGLIFYLQGVSLLLLPDGLWQSDGLEDDEWTG